MALHEIRYRQLRAMPGLPKRAVDAWAISRPSNHEGVSGAWWPMADGTRRLFDVLDDYDYDPTDIEPYTLAEAYGYARERGASRAVAREMAQQTVERYGPEADRRAVGVVVHVELPDGRTGDASLWGIDYLEADPSWVLDNYVAEVVDELTAEAVAVARSVEICPTCHQPITNQPTNQEDNR